MKIAVFFSIISCFTVINCYAQQQGVIQPHTNVYNFGRIKEGRVLRHKFTLKNTSEKTLKIISINTSCGCTISKVRQKVILPAQSSSVEVQFNTKGYCGPIEQHVYVQTDSPQNPLFIFSVKADIVSSQESS
jgi:hypothetical protein